NMGTRASRVCSTLRIHSASVHQEGDLQFAILAGENCSESKWTKSRQSWPADCVSLLYRCGEVIFTERWDDYLSIKTHFVCWHPTRVVSNKFNRERCVAILIERYVSVGGNFYLHPRTIW